jgi:hypothetical protein
MTGRSPAYEALVGRASFFFRRNGMVDLVDLAKADELGVSAETFTSDVAAQADEYARSLNQE